MTTYEVTVTREDSWWVADISGPNLGPAATDVERFADLEVEARDLIAGLTDTDPDSFALSWRYRLGGADVTEAVVRLAATDAEFRSASEAREHARADALAALADAGLSQAAIGDVLGLSHQRVHQLIKEAS